jgi:hypothetical protein
MKSKIIAKDRDHLMDLIDEEVQHHGHTCDLNHIDVSKVKEMHFLFCESAFNGDISEWDVSNVEHMDSMFSISIFDGDISKWNVSKVKSMGDMFYLSYFTGDLSNWKPFSLKKMGNAFLDCPAPIPYWANYEEQEARVRAINSYLLNKELSSDLDKNNKSTKKVKV